MTPCKDCIKEYHVGELKERLKWQHVRMKVEKLRDEARKEAIKHKNIMGEVLNDTYANGQVDAYDIIDDLLDGDSDD